MQVTAENIKHFLQNHRVFNVFELENSCGVSAYHTRNLLSKLQREGKIKKLRNSIYTVLPENAHDDFAPPALLIAAKMTDDAVLAYRSALAFYGLSRNLISNHTFISKHRIKACHVHGILYQPCLPPKQVSKVGDFAVVEHFLWNTSLRIVSKERLLVDSFDRLTLSGGWEEVFNAFQYENLLNWDQLLEYLRLLDNPATSARLGYFLEQCQETMMVPENLLLKLEKMKPRLPQHFFRSHRRGQLKHRWNLYIPEDVVAANSNEAEYAF